MPLSETQRIITRAMFAPIEAVDEPCAALAGLFSKGRIPLSEQLHIYRGHIVRSLADILLGTFFMVKKLAGEDFTRDMARAYLLKNPPREAYLNTYGATFPDFIQSYKPAAELPYLADAARLDWAQSDAFFAPDDPVLSPQDLAAVAPDDYAGTVFRLRRCVRLLRSSYPLDKIYDFCEQVEDGGEDGKPEMLNIDGPETFLLVTRIGLQAKLFRLEEAEFTLFSALADGQTLGAGLEAALEIDQDFDFTEFLQNYLALGTFSALHANEK